jgi:hypothetical protein
MAKSMGTIPAEDLTQFADVLDKAYAQSEQVRITRKDRVLARIVGEPFMRVIDRLLADDPGLADTIAILLNDEVQQALVASDQDVKKGRVKKLER